MNIKKNNMTNKETAIGILESVAHWMEKSNFDYDIKDLDEVLNEAKEYYKKYLKNKLNTNNNG